MSAALRLPETDPAALDPNAPGVNVERARGVVLMSPRPARPHTHAAGNLYTVLNGRFGTPAGPQGPGGWVIYMEPEIEIGDDDLIPDLAGWRDARAPEISAQAQASFDTAPDWLCEVLSPGTAAYDRADKLPIYAEWKVGHVWLLDPVLRTLEVYRLDGPGYRLLGTHKGPQVVSVEPFAACELDLALIWPPIPRPKI